MKISIINAIYGRGSTGVIVKDLQEFCMQSSIEAEIVYTQPYDLKLPYTFHMGNTLSNKLHALFSRVSGKQGYFSFLSTMKLIKHYDEFRPDIIHLHNLHNNYINLPMILKYIAKKNITFRFHNLIVFIKKILLLLSLCMIAGSTQEAAPIILALIVLNGKILVEHVLKGKEK